MAKILTRRKLTLADDIRAGLHEALDHARGKKIGAIVHRVPRRTDAREARLKLGLTLHEFATLTGTGVGPVRKRELGARR
jgi:DNA-binding transcriptional regulator YiaG